MVLAVDPVQHAVGAASRGVNAGQVSSQLLAYSTWVIDERAGNEPDDCRGHALRQRRLHDATGGRGQDRLVGLVAHGRRARMASGPRMTPSGRVRRVGFSDVGQRIGVAEDRKSLHEPIEVLGADDDGDRSSVTGDGHALALVLDPVHDVAEVTADVSERLNCRGHNGGAQVGVAQGR